MNRWLLLLLAVVGGAIAAYLAVLAVGGAILGFLWIYVFGDDTWPTGWEPVLVVFLGLVGLGVWYSVARKIWRRFRTNL